MRLRLLPLHPVARGPPPHRHDGEEGSSSALAPSSQAGAIAALGIAAHEVSHAYQDADGNRAVAEITGNTLYRVNDLKSGKKPKAPALATVLAGPVRGTGAT